MDVAIRELHHGRVWRANANRLVDERDGVLVLWSPQGNTRKVPLDADGAEIRIPQPTWTLGDGPTLWESLTLVRPGERHSLSLHRRDGRFDHWYVNLERHLGRTERTFDYVDHKLDLVVSPSGEVRWKDQDELELAAELGLLDAAAIRADAARVLADPPWPTGWEDWRPDPAWPAPVLPDGWEIV